MTVKEDTNRVEVTVTVSYETNGLVFNNTAGTVSDYNNGNWFRTSYPYYYQVREKSPIEQAFKIVSKLMEKKIINTMSLKQFIDTVNSVAEIL